MRSAFVAAVCAAFVPSHALAATNLVTNGSFELPNRNPTLTDGLPYYFYERSFVDAIGWSRTGSVWAWLESRPGNWVASDGTQYTEVEAGFAGAIFTSFATRIGGLYRVSYDYASDPTIATTSSDDLLLVLVNGVQEDAYDGTPTAVNTLDWTTRSFTFVATAAATELRFVDGVAGVSFVGAFLDNVSVVAVPEPEAAALMLAGLGIVGWAARRARVRHDPSKAN